MIKVLKLSVSPSCLPESGEGLKFESTAKDLINYALVMKLEGREEDILLKTYWFFGI